MKPNLLRRFVLSILIPALLPALPLVLAPASLSAQTLLTAPQLQLLAGICSGAAPTAASVTRGKRLLLLDDSGTIATQQNALPADLRAAGFADAGVLVCIDAVKTELELCNFTSFLSLPRVRRDYALWMHPLRANAVALATRVTGTPPPICSQAGTISSGQIEIAGELPEMAALLAGLAASGLTLNDADADGYSGIDEFLLGANAADAQSPGATLSVSLNGAAALTLAEGEALNIVLDFHAGQHFLLPTDYFLSIESAAATLAYIHPGQLRAAPGRELAVRAPALRFNDLPLLTVRDLAPGDYQVEFAALIDGRIELASRARVTITPARWQFSDITLAAGFDYTQGYAALGTGIFRDPQVVAGGGVAAGDYDNDGWVDLYVTRGTVGPNLLFRNLGNGTFADVAGVAGVDFTGSYSGALFADYDGDGWLDLLVTAFNGTQLKLLRNDGTGTFTDVTAKAGFPAMKQSIGASAADYDRDGDLDLWINHWLDAGNAGYLWRNNGDGTFTDVSAAAGIPNLLVADFTANFADIDNDGWLDVLATGDYGTSQIFHNERNGSFSIANRSVLTDENGMGGAVVDYDNDGDLDWFVSSVHDYAGPSTPERQVPWGATGNRLYQNQGNGSFRDVTEFSGTRIGAWGWGSCFADFNNDSHPDIFHVNGFTGGGHQSVAQFVNDWSVLFVADGSGRFTNQAFALGIADDRQGRGIVCFDFDRDGDVDIFIANNEQAPRLYRNDGGNRGNWLHVVVDGEAGNAQAIGARIYVTANGVTQLRELQAGSNYMSQNPVEAWFGLGTASHVEQLRVVWPSGAQRSYAQVAANRLLLIEHP